MARFPGLDGIVGALANRNYRLWTIGNGVSLIGTWMQRVGVGWLAWTLTESGAWLGVVAFADLVPTVLVGPLAGAFADRLDRLKVTKIGQSLAMAQAALLWLLTVTGAITIELLVALTATLGCVHAFGQPSRLALIPHLVKPHNVPAAIAINSMIFNTARFVGPAAAGVAIVYWGIGAAFLCNAVSFAAFLFALTRIRLEREERMAAATGDLWTALREGFAYTARHPGLGPLLLIMVVVGVCGRPFIELLPGFADRVFDAGAHGLALLTSTVGIGAVLGGFVLSGRKDTRGFMTVTLLGAALFALALLAFTATDDLRLAVPAVAVAGACIVAVGISTQTQMQMAGRPDMKGRILSLYGIIFRTGPGIGALAMGAASERVGLRWPVAAGAIAMLGLAIGMWSRRHRLQAALDGDRAAPK